MAAEKVHKSLRIDRGLADRMAALRRDGESDTALYTRALEAGAEALEGGGRPLEAEAEEPATEPGGDTEALEILRETVAMLKEDKEDLRRQLAEQADAYRKQIDTLSVITTEAQTIAKQSQTLQAAQTVAPKKLETAEENERRRGFWARLFDR